MRVRHKNSAETCVLRVEDPFAVSSAAKGLGDCKLVIPSGSGFKLGMSTNGLEITHQKATLMAFSNERTFLGHHCDSTVTSHDLTTATA